MYTKTGWLTAKGTLSFFIFILLFAFISTLSSCSTEEPIYYLYVTDYDEESVSVEIREAVGDKEIIVCVLDRYLDSHPKSEQIIKALDTQPGFNTPYTASIAYWRLVEDF